MPPSRPPPQSVRPDNTIVWETGRGMASRSAQRRACELCSREGMTRPGTDRAGVQAVADRVGELGLHPPDLRTVLFELP